MLNFESNGHNIESIGRHFENKRWNIESNGQNIENREQNFKSNGRYLVNNLLFLQYIPVHMLHFHSLNNLVSSGFARKQFIYDHSKFYRVKTCLSERNILDLDSCINNYMSNNQFKRGELYSFITGKASTAIARRLQKKFNTANLNITIEQWSVLYHLWKQDGISQQELGNASFRDKPSITRLVDNLEKLQLVKRVPSESDRRMNMIYLTKQAQKLQEQTMELANQTLNEALEGVSPDRIDVCREVLQLVYDNLK
ncbi:DNA-binding MarR family transcriptional regulator [Chitinophagaceae bacterium OAS944]